jgi:dihydropteroate synthase
MLLRARHFEFTFPRPALVMGIVNVTPDSFSDGGQFFDANAAVEHGLKLIAQGAEILDIGGESTRPRATPVSEAEELRRVIPVIEQLAAKAGSSCRDDRTAQRTDPTKPILISIDTMKPAVARAAIQAGASIINDVGANREDDSMWRIAADTGAAYVVMHMQGTPQTMHLQPGYADVVREVGEFFFQRFQRISGCGVAREQIIFDPGIGFGKTLEHNLQLLAALGSFRKLDRPLLLGASRKSFIGKLLGAELAGRLPASLACACLAVQAGVQIIRAHDVAETVQAIRMTEAVMAQKNVG